MTALQKAMLIILNNLFLRRMLFVLQSLSTHHGSYKFFTTTLSVISQISFAFPVKITPSYPVDYYSLFKHHIVLQSGHLGLTHAMLYNRRRRKVCCQNSI